MHRRSQLRWFIILICFAALIVGLKNAPENNTILIGIPIKNREILLPYFLSFFHRLTFPKEKILLAIFLGKSKDRTADIVNVWLENYGEEYKNVAVLSRGDTWDTQQIMEEVLNRARDIRIDYVMFLEPVAFLLEKDTIQHLMGKKRVVVAGMLRSPTLYSNFWGDMTDDLDYKRSYFYKNIISRENRGCFKAVLMHSCVLIDLRMEDSQSLSFLGRESYSIAFALNARAQKVPLFVCNDELFGFIMPFSLNSDNYDIKNEIHKMKEIKNLIHTVLNTLDPLEIFISSGFVKYPEIDNLGMDQIYVINLLRRPMKKRIMEERLKEVGLEAHFYEGVDGINLNSSYLMSIGANQLETYDDIYMTGGAIGCFLSHYFIWKDVIKNNYEKVMVLEDDTEFDLNFNPILKGALQELNQTGLQWEWLFVNRGTPMGPFGDKVKNSNHLQEVGYGMLSNSGYILSLKGAKKLATSSAVSEMLPIDEYILMMHSSQYRELRGWEHNYGPSNLKVYLIDPAPSRNLPFLNNSKKMTDTLHEPRTDDKTFGVPIDQKASSSKDEL